jgi:hypothetical protein
LKIKIGQFEFTEVWDGVLYKKLKDDPSISAWEMKNIAQVALYEKMHGRTCTIECENAEVKQKAEEIIRSPEKYLDAACPVIIEECTACLHRGCLTKWVCHTASPENAVKILDCGKLLSAVGARQLPAEQLMQEKRNAAKDPADYFYYVMLSWGNCQAGDRLVMERKLGRFPDEKDLSEDFTPGVRFYFRYDRLANHPAAVFDGVLPVKVRNEIVLEDWVDLIVVPMALKDEMLPHIPDALLQKTLFIENDCPDIWTWSKKVYETVESTAG